MGYTFGFGLDLLIRYYMPIRPIQKSRTYPAPVTFLMSDPRIISVFFALDSSFPKDNSAFRGLTETIEGVDDIGLRASDHASVVLRGFRV